MRPSNGSATSPSIATSNCAASAKPWWTSPRSSSAPEVPEDQEGLAQLSEILVFEKPFGDTAQDVVDLARTSLSECDGAGIQLLEDDRVDVRATTDSRSFDLDTLQDELDDGPCVESLRDGERHDLEPVTSDERWPNFAPPARRAGLVACCALPLAAHGAVIVVLKLSAWPAGGFA